MKVTAYSPGKVIFFGEHAVVYGAPALAATIDRGVEVALEKINEKPDYSKVESELIDKFQKQHQVELPDFKITVNNELPKGCGAGSAAAAALTKALYKLSGKYLDNKTLFEYVNFADQLMHGRNTSGLDAYTIVNGGYIFFDGYEFKKFDFIEKMEIIICDSGIRISTKKQLKKLEKLKKKDLKQFKLYMNIIEDTARIGTQYLIYGDLEKVGEKMYSNHYILAGMGMSCPELERIVRIAIERYEYGAKLTGAGGGGAAIILPRNPEKCLENLLSKGYKAFISKTG